MARGVWGIDVSKYSVKAARLERFREDVELTNVDVVQYAGAGTGDTEALEDQIREALADLKSNNRIGGERVVISLPSHSTFNRLVKLPPVDEAKIPEVIRYEAEQQIPFNIDEVIWDSQPVVREYAPGEDKEVILFAIKRDTVEQFLESIRQVDLNIDAIQFGPVALYNFLMRDQDLGGACVALDMGSDNTDLLIVEGPKFWVRNLPITGNDITRALQKAFNIPFSEAEKLKLKAGQSQQAQKIFNAIQPVLRDLVGEIHRSIGYYKSISKTIKFDRLLLLGNATRTLNFQKYLSQSLQMPASRLQKLNRIAAGRVDPGLLSNALPSLGTAIGLAMQGLGEAHNTVNLLPPTFKKKKELRKKQPYLVGVAASLYLLLGAVYLNVSGETDSLKRLSSDAAVTAKQLEENQDLHRKASQIEDLTKKLEPLTTIAGERDLMLKILNDVHPNIPDNHDRSLPDGRKAWILKWEAEERGPREPEGRRRPTRPRQRQSRILPARRVLDVTLEVAITKRAQATEAARFVTETLLNWDTNKQEKANPDLPSVIKTFGMKAGDREGRVPGWTITKDSDIPRLTAREPRGKLEDTWGGGFEDEPTRFSRVIVTFHLPVGEQNRPKPKAKAPKPAPDAGAGKEGN
ncbi:MAG: type IV pilus assembly protein PilM [Planctomycetota bacterium]|jgi:type IV pilus assembly protein PilM